MYLLEHTCDIYRMASTGQGISKEMQVLYQDIPCLALPMDSQSTIANGYDFGQGYDLFLNAGQDIKKGDKVQVGAVRLIVSGTKEFFGLQDVSHTQVMCQREEL